MTTLLARIIHPSCGASLGIRHHGAFASLTNTTSIRSVTENAVITTTVAIRSLSGELSRLGNRPVKMLQPYQPSSTRRVAYE